MISFSLVVTGIATRLVNLNNLTESRTYQLAGYLDPYWDSTSAEGVRPKNSQELGSELRVPSTLRFSPCKIGLQRHPTIRTEHRNGGIERTGTTLVGNQVHVQLPFQTPRFEESRLWRGCRPADGDDWRLWLQRLSSLISGSFCKEGVRFQQEFRDTSFTAISNDGETEPPRGVSTQPKVPSSRR